MSNQTGSAKAKDNSLSVKIDHKNPRSFERLNGKIARRAYQLYEGRGNPDGEHLEHWLQAESEFSARPLEIRESSSWYTVNVPLRDFAPEDVSVGVESTRAVIVAEKEQHANGTKEQHADSNKSAHDTTDETTTHESICLVATWPSDVDPSTASAYVKNGTLTLTVKRANSER
jgi:HSP20 family molecular chaperone IbpA